MLYALKKKTITNYFDGNLQTSCMEGTHDNVIIDKHLTAFNVHKLQGAYEIFFCAYHYYLRPRHYKIIYARGPYVWRLCVIHTRDNNAVIDTCEICILYRYLLNVSIHVHNNNIITTQYIRLSPSIKFFVLIFFFYLFVRCYTAYIIIIIIIIENKIRKTLVKKESLSLSNCRT